MEPKTLNIELVFEGARPLANLFRTLDEVVEPSRVFLYTQGKLCGANLACHMLAFVRGKLANGRL